MVYAVDGVMLYRAEGLTPDALSTVNEVEYYIFSLLLATGPMEEGFSEFNESSRVNTSVDTCHLLVMFSEHAQQCENMECVCKAIEGGTRQSLRKGRVIDRKMWIRFAKQQLNDILLKYSKEPKLHIFSACVEYHWLKNAFMALSTLSKAEDLRPSVPLTMCIFYLKREIEDAMIMKKLPILNEAGTNDKRLLDVRKVNKFMKLYNKFMEEVESCTTSNIAFWTILLDETPDTRKLNNVGNNISAYLKRIHTLYNKIMGADSSNINFLYKYGVFLRHIAFDELTANTIFSKIKTLKEKRHIRKKTKYDLFSMKMDKLVIMRISGNKNSLGKLLDVNFETTVQLKYEKEELIGTYVKRLMPSVIGLRHDDWILNAYSKMIFPKLNKLTQGFICDKNGYFVFVNMLMKLIPNLKEGINFMGAMQVNRRLSGYIQLLEEARESRKQFCVFICDESGRIIGINEGAGKYFGIAPREFNNKSEVTIQSLLPILADINTETKAKTKEGYICNIDFVNIVKQVGDSDRPGYDEDLIEKPKQVLAWIRMIDEVYGEKLSLPCKVKVVTILPISTRSSSKVVVNVRNHASRKGLESPNNTESEANREEARRDRLGDAGSMSGSVTTSSATSTTSDANSIREFKASLYERKNPFTVRLLKYTIWLLYGVLLTSCIVDWTISYSKANQTKKLFDLINGISHRMDHICTLALDTRTIDLIVRGLETNPYYGDRFYETMNLGIQSSMTELASVQSYLDSRKDLFTTKSYNQEHKEISLQLHHEKGLTRSQIFIFAVQEYIIHAVTLSELTTLKDMQSFYQSDLDYYDRIMHYMIEIGRDDILPNAERIALFIYEDAMNARANDKMVLLIIIIVSMGAAFICYLLIIPRVLSVVRHKSDVMQIFADIPNKNIREMIEGISQITISNVVYDSRAADENLYPDVGLSKLPSDDKKVKVRDESQTSKFTETPLAQAVTTNNNMETIENPKPTENDLDKAKVLKKRETLKQSDQGTRRRSLLTVTGFLLAIWLFYGGSIGIVELIFSYYNELSHTLKWVVLRRPYITLQFFMLKELLITNSTRFETEVDRCINITYEYERMMQSLKISSSTIHRKFKDLTLKLDSDQFCQTLKEDFGETLTERCQNFNQSSMARGMQNNIFQLFSDLNSVRNLYQRFKYTDYSFVDILKMSKWDVACKFCDYKQILLIVYVKNSFLDIAYEKLTQAYLEDADDFFTNAKTWTAIRNGCFIGALLISYFWVILGFIRRLKDEIWQTKGLLNLIPTKFILTSPELKLKFLSHRGL